MDSTDLYRVAFGKNNTEYYLKIFAALDRGDAWKACWNWSAAIFGPFWIAHRRIGHHFGFIFSFIWGFAFYWGMGELGPIAGSVLAIVAYVAIFPVTANYLYYTVVTQFIKDNSGRPLDELESLLKKRFETLTDKSNSLRDR